MPDYFVQKTGDKKIRERITANTHEEAAYIFVDEMHGHLYENTPGPVSVREFRKDMVHHFAAKVIWQPETLINEVRRHKRRNKRG